MCDWCGACDVRLVISQSIVLIIDDLLICLIIVFTLYIINQSSTCPLLCLDCNVISILSVGIEGLYAYRYPLGLWDRNSMSLPPMTWLAKAYGSCRIPVPKGLPPLRCLLPTAKGAIVHLLARAILPLILLEHRGMRCMHSILTGGGCRTGSRLRLHIYI